MTKMSRKSDTRENLKRYMLRNQGVTLEELSDVFNLSKSYLSGILSEWEKNGEVEWKGHSETGTVKRYFYVGISSKYDKFGQAVSCSELFLNDLKEKADIPQKEKERLRGQKEQYEELLEQSEEKLEKEGDIEESRKLLEKAENKLEIPEFELWLRYMPQEEFEKSCKVLGAGILYAVKKLKEEEVSFERKEELLRNFADGLDSLFDALEGWPEEDFYERMNKLEADGKSVGEVLASQFRKAEERAKVPSKVVEDTAENEGDGNGEDSSE